MQINCAKLPETISLFFALKLSRALVHGLRHTRPDPMNSLAGIHTPAIRHRRKRRNPSIASGIRRKFGIPASSLFHPKLHNKRPTFSATIFPASFRRHFEKSELSARKLAGWLWHSRFKDVSGDGDGDGGAGLEDWTLFRSSKYEIEFSTPCLNCCKGESTKWHPALSDKSNKSTLIESSNLLRDGKLRAQHFHAHRYINKHEAASKSIKKKIEEFIHPFEEEEEMSWKGREFQKIQSVLHFLEENLARERRIRKRMESLNRSLLHEPKEEENLTRERRIRKRMESLNRSLLHELKEANLSAKQSMKKYEEEKGDRELMEQLCNELAKQRVEDKANLKELQKKLEKIREEAEEERIMLKMLELWREEQVQMKLEDAKFVLEDRYNQMMHLIGNLEGFSRSELGIVDESEARPVTIGVEKDKSAVMEYRQKSSVVCAGESAGFGQRKWRSDAMNGRMKGLVEVEWPRVKLKTNLKPIPLEARLRKQKSQLQLMLKPNA